MKKTLSVLCVLALSTCAAGAETLTAGHRGEDVRQVQSALIQQGYLEGGADGIYGDSTSRAVSAFQQDNGLTATGDADDATQAAILESVQSMQEVQQALIDMGYMTGAADGLFGAQTAAALEAFQRDNELTVTGEADDATREAVLKLHEQRKYAQQILMELGYLEDRADGVFGAQTAAALEAFQAAEGLTVTGRLDAPTQAAFEGVREEHRAVQQALVNLGYEIREVDGSYGRDTVDAVKAFQREHGLKDTGKVSEDLKMTLFAVSEAYVETVRAQERLMELGYLADGADGMFGPNSREALKKFQSANGLEPDGELDEETLEKLFDGEAQGDTVRMAQARLIELGYMTGAVDGAFGPKSVKALTLFQQVNGLTATGEMDDETWEKLFSDDVKIVLPELKLDDRGDDVKALQQRLLELGFTNERADGVYGKKTEKAVRAFQDHAAEQGLFAEEITGTATSLTREILMDADYSPYVRDVVPGEESPEVLRVERRLRNLGYLDAEPDELYDAYAAEALRAFQRAENLEDHGTADEVTSAALFGADAEKAAHYVPHPVQRGESGGVVKDAQTALIRLGLLDGQADGVYGGEMERALEEMHDVLEKRNSADAALFADRGSLSAAAQEALMRTDLLAYESDIVKGSDAEEVLRVQRRLTNLFYLSASGQDGDFGPSSRKALEKFQKANGLSVTGTADRETQNLLFSDEAVGNWTRYKLEVSTADQRVYVFELNDKNQYEHIDTFICSTGLGNSTPKGVYTSTTEPLDRWHYFVEYKCWAQYAYRIVGPYYFHSVIYSGRDESTLRRNSLYALGSKASHGCVRLKVEDAKWIYQNCDAGTIVEVY